MVTIVTCQQPLLLGNCFILHHITHYFSLLNVTTNDLNVQLPAVTSIKLYGYYQNPCLVTWHTESPLVSDTKVEVPAIITFNATSTTPTPILQTLDRNFKTFSITVNRRKRNKNILGWLTKKIPPTLTISSPTGNNLSSPQETARTNSRKKSNRKYGEFIMFLFDNVQQKEK